MPKLTRTAIGCLNLVFFTGAALAQPAATEPARSGTDITFNFSPYTAHFNPKPTHKPVLAVGLERRHANDDLDGVVLFSNSFGQPSVYVYPVGQVFDSIFGVNGLSFKWTAGLVVGYRGEFKDEVANFHGIAPVVIPALAYEFKKGVSAQLNLLGKAALQLQFNIALD